MHIATAEDARIFEGQKRLSKAFLWGEHEFKQNSNCDFENIFDQIEVQIDDKLLKQKDSEMIETRLGWKLFSKHCFWFESFWIPYQNPLAVP